VSARIGRWQGRLWVLFFEFHGLLSLACFWRPQKENPIHIPNPEVYKAKLSALVRGGRSQLTVVADFDRTLTSNRISSGERCVSCHGIVESCDALSKSYRDATTVLFNKYFPIEVSPHIPVADKIPMMRQWYAENHKELAKERLTRADLVRAVAGSNVQLRPGARSLVATCSTAGIPMLVFSAGIKDVIEEVIAQHYGALPDGLHVVSNKMAWSSSGVNTGFHSPLIHMYNKDESHLKGVRWFAEAGARKNALVLGDSLGDAGMAGADGARHETVLRVGFLNETEAEGALLADYSAAFDVVVLRDSSLDFVLYEILGRVLEG
jgi:5'-nucleotidase